MPIFPRHRHLPDIATSGHPAAVIAVVPSGDLAETNVQAALEGLQARMPDPDLYNREVVRESRTYYVRTDGDDASHGLTNTPTGAFKTFTRVVQELNRLHIIGNATVRVQVNPGDYLSEEDWNAPAVRISAATPHLPVVIEPYGSPPATSCKVATLEVREGGLVIHGLNVAGLTASGPGVYLSASDCVIGIPDQWCYASALYSAAVQLWRPTLVSAWDGENVLESSYNGSLTIYSATFAGDFGFDAPAGVLVTANSSLVFRKEWGSSVPSITLTGTTTGLGAKVDGASTLAAEGFATFPLGDQPIEVREASQYNDALAGDTLAVATATIGTETGLVKRVDGQLMTAAPGDGYVATGVDFLVFYLRQDGSDDHDGLADSPDRAFRTFNRVKAEAAKYRLNGSHVVDWDLWDEDFPWFAGSPYVLVYFGPGDYAEEWENGNTWLTWDRQDVALEIRSTTGLSSDVELYGIQVNDGCSVHVRQVTVHSIYCYGNVSAGYGDAARGIRILFDGDGCGFQARDGGIIYVYGHVDLIASDPSPDHQFWAPFSAGYGAKCVTYNGCVVNVSGTFKTAQCAGIAYAYATGFVFFRSTTFNIAGGTVLPKQATALNGGVIQSNSHTIATFPGNGTPNIDDLGSSFLGRTRQKELIVPNLIDTNGNEILKTGNVASAVNELTITNAASGGKPQLSATGNDTNITLNLVPKGSGTVQANGVDVATLSGTQTLTNKTLSGLKVSSVAAPSSAAATGTAGEVRLDSNYLYYCVATNTWKRTPLSTW